VGSNPAGLTSKIKDLSSIIQRACFPEIAFGKRMGSNDGDGSPRSQTWSIPAQLIENWQKIALGVVAIGGAVGSIPRLGLAPFLFGSEPSGKLMLPLGWFIC
jgi:hypothetical protein